MSLFKKPTKKVQIRKKLDEEEQDDGRFVSLRSSSLNSKLKKKNSDSMKRLEDIKELQKARERKNGLTEVECAVGKDKVGICSFGEAFRK